MNFILELDWTLSKKTPKLNKRCVYAIKFGSYLRYLLLWVNSGDTILSCVCCQNMQMGIPTGICADFFIISFSIFENPTYDRVRNRAHYFYNINIIRLKLDSTKYHYISHNIPWYQRLYLSCHAGGHPSTLTALPRINEFTIRSWNNLKVRVWVIRACTDHGVRSAAPAIFLSANI